MFVDDRPTTAKALVIKARKELNDLCETYLKKEDGKAELPMELRKSDWTALRNFNAKKKNTRYPSDIDGKKDYSAIIVEQLLDGNVFKNNKRVGCATILNDYSDTLIEEQRKVVVGVIDKINSILEEDKFPCGYEQLSKEVNNNDQTAMKSQVDEKKDADDKEIEENRRNKNNKEKKPINCDVPDYQLLHKNKDMIFAEVDKKVDQLKNYKLLKNMKTLVALEVDLQEAQEKVDVAEEDNKQLNTNVFGRYEYRPPNDCKPNLFNSRVFTGEVLHQRDVNEVRVMHQNILADGLSGSSLSLNEYSKSLEKQFASPKECLDWDYRKWLILEEIAHYEPDIITLVELDSNQDYYGKDFGKKLEDCFWTWRQDKNNNGEDVPANLLDCNIYLETLKQGKQQPDESVVENAHAEASKALQYYLEKIGYSMEYKAKGASFAEMGTGFFWKKEKLEAVPLEPKNGADKPTGNLLWKSFNPKNGKQIFTLMRFKQRKGELKLAVCALHLQSEKQQDGEIKRAMQVWEALQWLNYPEMRNELTQIWEQMKMGDAKFEHPEDITDGVNIMDEYALIITGDFNAERGVSAGTHNKIVRPLTVSALDSTGFKSFYDEVYGSDLPWTSWKKRPVGRTDRYTIDYVFGSKEKTSGLAVLGGVPDKMLDPDILLPSYESGSDHISLVVDFELLNMADPVKRGAEELIDYITIGKILTVVGTLVIVAISMRCRNIAGTEKGQKAESSTPVPEKGNKAESSTSVEQRLQHIVALTKMKS